MNALFLKCFFMLVLTLSFLPGKALSFETSRIDPLLQNHIAIAIPGEEIPIIIRMADKVAIQKLAVSTRKKGSARAQARSGLVRSLKAKADQSQRSVRKLLGRHGRSNVKNLWMVNGLALKASPSLIEKIAQMPGVASVEFDRVVAIPESLPVQETSPAEQNLSLIRAPNLWALGYSGSGVTVAIMDSGVDVNHPDLGPRWRGGSNSWYDPNDEHPDVPTDLAGHGTKVTGVVLGGDSGATVIGVAPEAQWIGVKIFNDAGDAPISVIHDGLQWLLDPDGNPGTDDAPDIVNNSWGFEAEPGVCNDLSLVFQPDIQALMAAGIAVVFSAGNTGSDPNTSVAPANYPESFSAGSIGTLASAIEISDFSARGPSACDNSIYPEVVAPGYFVKTSDLTAGGAFPNSYAFVSGTSFAAPHVSGAMALLLGAFPDTLIASLETALKQSAVDLGVAGEDNTYGYGMIDSLAAFNYLAGQTKAELRLLTPNGGEVLSGGGSQTIQWGAYPDAATYRLRLSVDGGASWGLIEANVTGTSYLWTPPRLNSDQALISLTAYDNLNTWLSADTSDAVFSLQVPGDVLLLTPNGGETISGGESLTIQWGAYPDAATYLLRLSLDGGANWGLIEASATGTSYLWTPPRLNSDQALISVTAYDNLNTWLGADTSDAVFSLQVQGDVVSPAAGEVYLSGETIPIDWQPVVGAGYYLVRGSVNSGVNWFILKSAATETQLNWTAPDLTTTNALVRITAYGAGGEWLLAKGSDKFAIYQPGEMLSPNGGEQYLAGTQTTVSWVPVESAARYLVRLSLDNGTTWGRLADHLTEPQFEWRIPRLNSTDCLIRVTAYDASDTWLNADSSDGIFSISNP